MTYGDFKDLPRRRASDKVLDNKAFNTAKNPKFDGYQKRCPSMAYKCLIRIVLRQKHDLFLILFLLTNN